MSQMGSRDAPSATAAARAFIAACAESYLTRPSLIRHSTASPPPWLSRRGRTSASRAMLVLDKSSSILILEFTPHAARARHFGVSGDPVPAQSQAATRSLRDGRAQPAALVPPRVICYMHRN